MLNEAYNYITKDNSLYVYGNVSGADVRPQKILNKVRYVNAQLYGDYAVKSDGTLYDLSEIVDCNKDKPKKKAKGL